MGIKTDRITSIQYRYYMWRDIESVVTDGSSDQLLSMKCGAILLMAD